MTKEELLDRLTDIEWNDFEVKAAQNELPKNVWETVSAFANTSGGWIVLGVEEVKLKGKSNYMIKGVANPEKQEQDFVGTLRSRTKFNVILSVNVEKYTIGGASVLAFYVPSSPIKPVYINNNISNTFIRTGSGDQRANDLEIVAIQRDQAFGCRSEQKVTGTSFADLNVASLSSYRGYLRAFNVEFAYNHLSDEEFCAKLGITVDGVLIYGSLLMFGKRDSVKHAVPNFWIDYIEIPGISVSDAKTRYSYRMPEQENIWESYMALIQRLRLYVDNPFTMGPDGFAPDDNSQLYTLREGLVNMLSHADHFSPMHPTIRVFDNRIDFQNPGCFIFDINHADGKLISMPRNPSILHFFRYAKLSENAGYGLDRIREWKKLTGQDVLFHSELMYSSVTYMRSSKQVTDERPETDQKATRKRPESDQKTRQVIDEAKLSMALASSEETKRQQYIQMLQCICSSPFITRQELSKYLNMSDSAVKRRIAYLKDNNFIYREGSDKQGCWRLSDNIVAS